MSLCCTYAMYATHWGKAFEAALFSSFVGSQFRPISSILSASSHAFTMKEHVIMENAVKKKLDKNMARTFAWSDERIPGDDRHTTSSDYLLIFPLSTLFHHLSDPITFAHTHTTLKIKARDGAQHTYPNINFQERLQIVQHPDTHTHSTSWFVFQDGPTVFFCFFATVQNNTTSQKSKKKAKGWTSTLQHHSAVDSNIHCNFLSFHVPEPQWNAPHQDLRQPCQASCPYNLCKVFSPLQRLLDHLVCHLVAKKYKSRAFMSPSNSCHTRSSPSRRCSIPISTSTPFPTFALTNSSSLIATFSLQFTQFSAISSNIHILKASLHSRGLLILENLLVPSNSIHQHVPACHPPHDDLPHPIRVVSPVTWRDVLNN